MTEQPYKHILRKIHITVPAELYYEIKNRKLFSQIDSIFVNLMTEYLEELDNENKNC